jgi:hypothetical protein
MIDFPLEFQFQGNWNPAPVAMPDGKVWCSRVSTEFNRQLHSLEDGIGVHAFAPLEALPCMRPMAFH